MAFAAARIDRASTTILLPFSDPTTASRFNAHLNTSSARPQLKRAAELFVLASMALVVIAEVAEAQNLTVPPQSDKRQGSPFAKLGSGLAQLFEEKSTAQGAAFQPSNALRVRQDLVLIDAVASSGAEALRSELESLGGHVRLDGFGLVPD